MNSRIANSVDSGAEMFFGIHSDLFTEHEELRWPLIFSLPSRTPAARLEPHSFYVVLDRSVSAVQF